MKKLSLILGFACIVFISCQKDKNNDVPLSKTEVLTTGSWKITAILSDNDGNGTKETDDYASFPSCLKDDFYTFKSGSVLERNEGASTCNPSDPQTDNRTWQLAQNETRLIIDGDEYIIVELTTTNLRFEDVQLNYGTRFTMTKR